MGEEGLVDCKFIRKVVVRPAAWSKKFALYAKVVSSVGAKFVAVLCVAFVLLRRARTKTEWENLFEWHNMTGNLFACRR